jgi:DNA mismatch endonuclease (patch repair protein)
MTNVRDPLSPEERSRRMSLVRAKDTKPELRVRRLVHAMGYRYRIHVQKLPGCPDMVFQGRRKVIFVHGCFWHQHNCAMGNRMPKSRVDFWRKKLEGNKKRGTEINRQLIAEGWSSFIVWECQTRNSELSRLTSQLKDFLGPAGMFDKDANSDSTSRTSLEK